MTKKYNIHMQRCTIHMCTPLVVSLPSGAECRIVERLYQHTVYQHIYAPLLGREH